MNYKDKYYKLLAFLIDLAEEMEQDENSCLGVGLLNVLLLVRTILVGSAKIMKFPYSPPHLSLRFLIFLFCSIACEFSFLILQLRIKFGLVI